MGEICGDSHTIKTVINTCIVPGVWVCVTSTFSFRLERNQRTYVLVAGAPRPATRRMAKCSEDPQPLALPASLPGAAHGVCAGETDVRV